MKSIKLSMPPAVPLQLWHFIHPAQNLNAHPLTLACIGTESLCCLNPLFKFLRQCIVVPHKDVVHCVLPFCIFIEAHDFFVASAAPEFGAGHWFKRGLGHSIGQTTSPQKQRVAITLAFICLESFYFQFWLLLYLLRTLVDPSFGQQIVKFVVELFL